MRRPEIYALLVVPGVCAAVAAALVVYDRWPDPAPPVLSTLPAQQHLGGLVIKYPLDGTLFPPEIAPATFLWADRGDRVDAWQVTIEFSDGKQPIQAECLSRQWTPSDNQWEEIKRRSRGAMAKVFVRGVNRAAPQQVLASGSVSFGTSPDEVGAPLFYREVILPFIDAVKEPFRLRWRFGEVSSKGQPPVVLEGLPVCGNCHSFSADGAVLGMDVDYASNKGSYAICRVAEEMTLDRSNIITWDDYRKEDKEQTFGLLSQVSPDGKYVVSTVKDDSVFVPRPDLAFSQLFFPVKGILVFYDRQKGTFQALPGADDRQYVHSNPSWSPDGKYLVFARGKAYQLKTTGKRTTALLSADECKEFLQEGKTFQYDLYRIPFNGGKGGKAEPLEGASQNGMSNYFAKYSPDGKWIVFCQAKTFMLLQPDSQLFIIPAQGGKARRLACNTARMNSWHSWSPNGKWLVFSSKANRPYTQLFLTHIDATGQSSPAVVLDRLTAPDRAANIPEFVHLPPGAIKRIRERFVDDHSLVRAGHEYLKQADWQGAAAAFRKALEMNPDNADAHAAYGAALAHFGPPEEVKTHLLRAIELNPKDAASHVNMAAVLKQEKKLAEATVHCREALRLDPNQADAHLTLGAILLESGSLPQATQHLSEAVRLGGSPEAHHLLGMAWFRQEKLGDAAAEFRAELAQRPGDAFSHLRLGQVLLRQRDLAQAEEHLRTAIRLDPKAAEAYFHLGGLCLLKKQPPEAVAQFRQAIAADPSFVPAIMTLARLYATAGDERLRNGAEAVRLAEQGCQLAGGESLPYLDTLAAAYAEAGNFEQAVRTAARGKTLAEQSGNAPLAAQFNRRLLLYQAGKPLHASSP